MHPGVGIGLTPSGWIASFGEPMPLDSVPVAYANKTRRTTNDTT